MLDRQANITIKTSIAQGAHTASVNGTSVDLAGVDGATVYILPGTWTDGSHTIKVQDSPDNSTFTDCTAASLVPASANGAFTAITSSGTAVAQKLGYVGTQRYIRAVSTVSGATTGAIYTVVVVLDAQHKLPAAA